MEMLSDVRKGIWKEAMQSQKVDVYRRNLQRAYIDRMGYLMTAELSQGRGVQYYYNVNQSDVRALVRAELKALQRQLTTAKGQTADTLTKYHYEDCIERINQLLEPK